MTPPRERKPMEFDDYMGAADALMWHIEADPILRSTILSVWLLDRAPSLERFDAKAERATQLIPRLRQRVVNDPIGLSPPRWEDDPYFDLRFHVRHHTLPAGSGERALLDLAEPIAMQAFDKDRPLWELHLVDGLEEGRCAVMMKLHHAISDGVGLVRMTECLIEHGPDDDFAAEPLATVAPSAPAPSSLIDDLRRSLAHRARTGAERFFRLSGAVAREAGAAIRHPLESAREAANVLDSAGRLLAPASEPLSPIMRERSPGVSLHAIRVPLDELKRAGRSVDGTINDAFVASVAGGLARYHAELGSPVETLRMLMPVNVRGGEGADRAGNQFAPVRFELPVGMEDAAERVRAIGRICRAQRDEPALPWLDEIASALGALPPSLTMDLFGAMQKTTDFTTSNVPGPRRATWMSGARIEGFMPFGPLAGAAVNVTAFSYDGDMQIGINADPAAVTEPERLVSCLEQGFDEVLALAHTEGRAA